MKAKVGQDLQSKALSEALIEDITDDTVVAKTKELAKAERDVKKLRKFLAEVATPEQLQQWIVDLCRAEDRKMTPYGEQVTPAWEARFKGLNLVMKTLGYAKEEVRTPIVNATKIVIEVIDDKKEIIDVKEEPQ